MAFKNFKDLSRSLQKHTAKIKRASTSAANKAIGSTKVQAVRSAAKATGAQAKLINARFEMFKSNPEKPYASLVINSKPISLTAFAPKTKRVSSARGKRTGVTTNTPKGRTLVVGGFLATGKSKTPAVFARETKDRYPIKRLTSDAVFTFISSPEQLRILEEKATVEFQKQIASQLKRFKLED